MTTALTLDITHRQDGTVVLVAEGEIVISGLSELITVEPAR
jgi:hypothetical protein